ncbi:hypothetical protein Tco_1522861 [Tanacetum coccineum]
MIIFQLEMKKKKNQIMKREEGKILEDDVDDPKVDGGVKRFECEGSCVLQSQTLRNRYPGIPKGVTHISETIVANIELKHPMSRECCV